MSTDTEAPNTNVPEGDAGAEPSLRDTLEQQWDAHEAAQAPDAPNADGVTKAAPAPDVSRETAPQITGDRARDEHGRFVPKDAGGAPRAPAPASLVPQGPVQPPAPATDLKAPGAWKPEVREAWARVPPEVQGEVVRREREFQQVLMQAAGARQFTDAFERVVAPYQLFIRQENATPLQAVENLMMTAAILRTGNQRQRVECIGSIIRNWCSTPEDLQALDTFLAQQPGQQPQGNGALGPQQFRDPRVDQMLAQQAQMQQAEAQRMEQEFDQGIEWFAQQPGHEFFNDVRVMMGDLIDMAGRRGEVLPMEDAYKRACQLDPSVSKILAQRATAQNTNALSQAALRAKRAARSVTGDSSPAGVTVPKGDSVRAALEAAFEAHSGN